MYIIQLYLILNTTGLISGPTRSRYSRVPSGLVKLLLLKPWLPLRERRTGERGDLLSSSNTCQEEWKYTIKW